MHLARRGWLTLGLLAIALVLGVAMAASLGAVSIPLRDALTGSGTAVSATNEFIFWQVRLPRVVLSALVGAALAVAGAILQGLFRNPLAEPYVAGVSFGGALGATLVMLFGGVIGQMTVLSVPAAAFAGALLATFVVYRLARVGAAVPVSTLILAGIAVSSFLSAVISLLMVLQGEDLLTLVFWLMGGLSARSWLHVRMVLPFMAVGFPLALVFARELNLFLMGEERASQLGVDAERAKRVLLVAAALLSGAAVAVSGLIGFVGLIIPHVVRLVIGPEHRVLLPAVALFGALFLVGADTIARLLIAPAEIPVGVVTALFGAPFFIYLLRTKRGSLA